MRRRLFSALVILTSLPGLGRAIECSETVADVAIAQVGERVLFEFEAEAGDRAVITSATRLNVEPVIRLFQGSGTGGAQVLLNGSPAFCPNVCVSPTLPSSGTYTIEVADSFEDESGSFDLTLDAATASFNGSSYQP